MTLTLTSKPKQLVPAGVHTAICYSIIDLGTHLDDTNDDPNAKPVHKVRLTWELCEELMDNGRPFSIGKEYSVKLSPKATITIHIKAWLGQDPQNGFQLRHLLGKACNMNVVHATGKSGNAYAKIESITPLKKNEVAPAQANASVFFEMDTATGALNQSVFNALPDFVKEKIMLSPEYQEIVRRVNGVDDFSGPAPGFGAENESY